MRKCSNATIPADWNPLCMPPLFWVISGSLVLSLSCNLIFCVVKSGGPDKKTCWSRIRRRRSPQQMEDNPIYGNVNCIQTNTTAIAEINLPHSTAGASSPSNPLRSSSDSQSKPSDCYANLSLKTPKSNSACSSPQIQYSSVFQTDETRREEVKGSVHSDLYASVQTKRNKTIDNAEGYANHVSAEP